MNFVPPAEQLLFLTEMLVKSGMVLTAAFLVNRLWTRASAAQRHLVWFAALILLLLFPLTPAVQPRWSVPVVRVKMAPPIPEPPTISPVSEAAPAPGPPNPPIVVKPRSRPGWPSIVMTLWATGVVLLLASRLLGSVCLLWLRTASRRAADERIKTLAQEVFAELGLRRRVDLRLSSASCVPLTWGTWRPVLLLPNEACAWTDEHLRAALRHEAGHMIRGDHATRWLADAACALYWPNPLVWFAARQLRTAQEEATDDLVLQAGTSPDEYAEQLLDLARTLTANHRLVRSAVAMASPSTLERRMLAIVDNTRSRRPLGRGALFSATLAITLTLAGATAARLQAQQTQSAPQGPGTATYPKRRIQVNLAAKFFEFDPATVTDSWLTQSLKTLPGGLYGIYGREQSTQLLVAIEKESGGTFIAAPKMSFYSGTRTVTEIIREYRYPSKWRKEGGIWQPEEFETSHVGISIAALAKTGPEDTLDLTIEPSIRELLGFSDVDTGTPYPMEPKRTLSAEDLVSPVPKEHRSMPIFWEGRIENAVTIRSGQTVVIAGLRSVGGNDDFPRRGTPKQLLVFITAEIQPEPSWEKAASIIIPAANFRDVPLTEALEQLRRQAFEADLDPLPMNRGVNIILAPGKSWNSPGRVTADFVEMPLTGILTELATRQNLKIDAQPSALILRSSPRVEREEK